MKYITLLAVPMLATSVSASLMIDTFNDSATDVTVTGVSSNVDIDTGLLSAIGGSRETRVHNTSTTGSSDQNNATTNGSEFTWSQEVDSVGHFHLAYGSLIASPNDFNLNADFASDNAIVINIISTDVTGIINVSLEMNVGEANESLWSQQILVTQVGGLGHPSPYEVIFNFGDFTKDSGTGSFDKSDVDGIIIEAATDLNSADWKFDQLSGESVPEPSSTALLGLGGLALVLRRRR